MGVVRFSFDGEKAHKGMMGTKTREKVVMFQGVSQWRSTLDVWPNSSLVAFGNFLGMPIERL